MEKENTMSGNKTLGLKISDLLHDGRGVGRINGKAYFVEGALPVSYTHLTLPTIYSV